MALTMATHQTFTAAIDASEALALLVSVEFLVLFVAVPFFGPRVADTGAFATAEIGDDDTGEFDCICAGVGVLESSVFETGVADDPEVPLSARVFGAELAGVGVLTAAVVFAVAVSDVVVLTACVVDAGADGCPLGSLQ
jgi:hypothetical protein